MKSLIRFSSGWCGMCKNLEANMLNANLLGATVKKVNIDSEDGRAIARANNVDEVPTIILIEDGIEVKRTSEVLTSKEIEDWIKTGA